MMTRSRKRRKTMGRPLPIVLATPAALAGAAGYVIWRRRAAPSAVAAPASGRRVTEAMTPNPRSIAPSATVGDAARLMRMEDVGSLPVVQDGRLTGMVTDRDIAMRVVAEGKDPQMTTVGEIASGELVTVQPEESLDEALRLAATGARGHDQRVGVLAVKHDELFAVDDPARTLLLG